MSRRPIASLTLSRKDGDRWLNYSVLSIWETDNAGLYSISADRGSEKYPPLGLIDAIKMFAQGARMSIRVTSETQPRERREPTSPGASSDFGGRFDDPDSNIPF